MECLTCQAEGLQANNRRRLHGDSTKHLVPLLEELVCHPSAGLVLHDDAFLCRPCFRKLEKLQKLREDTTKLEEELKEALRSCIDRLAESGGIVHQDTGTDGEIHTPSKREADSAGLATPIHHAKRARYTTPIRRTLQLMVPKSNSPQVAVSK